jgi:ribokinase
VEAALRKASLYAAHSITRPGTQKAYASADEFETFCRDHAPLIERA